MPAIPTGNDRGESLPLRFRRVAERHGARIAVRSGGEDVSYAELLVRVRRVAALVRRELRDEPGAVLLLMSTGCDLVAATLGVLEAGAWFVPLDPAQPPERLRELATRAEARLVLADEGHAGAGTAASSGAIPVRSFASLPPPGDAPSPVAPDALAYVYFTSGTTGPPKGVMDTHRNVLDNVARYARALGWTPEDRLTLLQAAHFSGAVSNVFGALTCGAMLLPYDVGQRGAGAPLADWLAREAPTIWHSVPSLFRSVCLPGRRFPSVRVVRVEGDSGSPSDLARLTEHFGDHAMLAHGLGATETGLVCQYRWRRGDRIPDRALPVGRAVDGITVRVLDEHGEPVAPGTPGEIAVRGRRLAPGYWRDPERTALAFRDVADEPGVREYRTGDVGRVNDQGELEHLGRRDAQLKVRGRWVDAALVESRLAAIDGVAEAAVVRVPDEGGEHRLGAFLVLRPDAELTAADVRATLARELPDHAVPAAVRVVTALPLGPHGKLDRTALPHVDSRALREGGGEDAPSGEREATLAAIWREVLGLERVGRHDRFVELGGDSLYAVRVAVEIERRLGVSVPHAVLAEAPTIEALAARLGGGAAGAPGRTLVVLRRSGIRPPLFVVHDRESDAFLFAPLARRLGGAQPVVALRAPAGEPIARIPATIEGLARRYLADARPLHPGGPWRVAGFCFGGVVAMEMARQLAARGERVSLLALLNVTPFDLFPLTSAEARRRFRRDWAARVAYLARKRDRATWIARRLRSTASERAWGALLPLWRATHAADTPAPAAVVRAALAEAFREYEPRPHEGDVILCLAEETLTLYADDPHRAWRSLARGHVAIHRFARDGDAMLAEPDVAELARILEPHLARDETRR